MDVNTLVHKLGMLIGQGTVLALLFYTITPADDTTFHNVSHFVGGFIILSIVGQSFGLKEELVITTFMTKLAFILLDEKTRTIKQGL